MMKLGSLWRGELPLNEAFWTWTVTIGLVVNITSTLMLMLLITLDQPWAALFIGYVVSVPYNIVAVVGVWRSAARYQGPNLHSDFARGASAVLMAVLSLT